MILLCDPTKVYFQDSVQFPFHFEFATQHLDPLVGLSLEEFNQVTLFAAGQQAVLGAVVLPPTFVDGFKEFELVATVPEYGIQFVGEDPLDPQMVVDLFNLVQRETWGSITVLVNCSGHSHDRSSLSKIH